MVWNSKENLAAKHMLPVVDSMMKSMNKWFWGTTYDNATHGFARAQDDPKTGMGRDGQPVQRDPAEEQANRTAIKDAWPRTVSFFKTNLK